MGQNQAVLAVRARTRAIGQNEANGTKAGKNEGKTRKMQGTPRRNRRKCENGQKWSKRAITGCKLAKMGQTQGKLRQNVAVGGIWCWLVRAVLAAMG